MPLESIVCVYIRYRRVQILVLKVKPEFESQTSTLTDCLCVQVSSGCYGSSEVGGLDGVRAAVLPAANRPHPRPFSFTG